MSASTRLAAFAAVATLVLVAAAAAGSLIGPEPRAADEKTTAGMGGHAGGGDDEVAARPVRGLAVAEGGLRLVLGTPELRRGAPERLEFTVVEADGSVVRDFEVENEKRMHLIVARRDLTGFQHLHPRQRADGSWRTRVRVPDAGSHRVFADFLRGGEPYTLASDLRVDGAAELRDLPDPEPLAPAGQGYSVRLDNDPITAGREAELRFTAHRDGRAVQVEEYLGAGGHLVALREGDLAYLHVHPEELGGEAAPGDYSVGFGATFPTTGRYRLFLQFKHAERIRTAAFTVEVD